MEWVALTVEKVQAAIKKASKEDLHEKFQTQADVLVHTAEAALLVGGTPTDRPEDVEISPFDNTLFIAHTNNEKHGNFHGQLHVSLRKTTIWVPLNLILKSLSQVDAKADSVLLIISRLIAIIKQSSKRNLEAFWK